MLSRLIIPIVLVVAGAAAPADPVRATAEWALRQGGRIRLAGSATPLTDLSALPAGTLRITALDLMGAQLEPQDLERIAPLADLEELYLPAYMWNPGAGSRLDANEALRNLAGLKKLRKFQLGLHFLTNINVQDKGLAHLAPLTQIEELRLAQTRVKGLTLATFVHLRALDLTYSTFGDEGMQSLKDMHELTRLYLRDTLVSDAGLKWIADRKSLTELDLSGDRITDAGMESLRGLTNLRELNLLGAAITDAGLDALAGMTHLRNLNLYRTGITNAGVEKLKALRELVALDLRYTRATSAAVDSLAPALPECAVTFLSSPTRRAGTSKEAPRPAGPGEKALADWVRAVGGNAVFAGSRLREISLANTAVTDAQLAYLEQAPNLEKLSLETTQVGDAGARSLAKLTALVDLNLNQTTITDAGLKPLAALKLRRLSLDHTLVNSLPDLPATLVELELAGTAASMDALQHIASITGLQRLNLSYTDITDESLVLLAPLGKLRSLDLTSTEIGDVAAAHLESLAGLEELSLNYTRIGDKGVQAVAQLSNLKSLEIVRTRVTDAALTSLASLASLSHLNLNYTKVTDRGLWSLSAMPSLRELLLDTAAISDAGLEVLRGHANLKVLNLYHTLVTQKGYDALHSALPDCRIVWDRDSSLPNRRGS